MQIRLIAIILAVKEFADETPPSPWVGRFKGCCCCLTLQRTLPSSSNQDSVGGGGGGGAVQVDSGFYHNGGKMGKNVVGPSSPRLPPSQCGHPQRSSIEMLNCRLVGWLVGGQLQEVVLPIP